MAILVNDPPFYTLFGTLPAFGRQEETGWRSKGLHDRLEKARRKPEALCWCTSATLNL